MSYPVTYHCPRCETIVELQRDGYLADKSVTPFPFEGWSYADATEPFEDDAADGVRLVCGESDGVVWDPRRPSAGDGAALDDAIGNDGDGPASGDGPTPGDTESGDVGCGEIFYLSFVRYEDGREIEPARESDLVTVDPDPRPAGPEGPDGPNGGFW